MAGKMLRPIVVIDESKCNGCGECVTACAEGALQIINGKAKLVSEVYCDGLGACLGECPQGAITVEQREAEAFDEKAVDSYLAQREQPQPTMQPSRQALSMMPTHAPQGHGCPGSMARTLRPALPAQGDSNAPASQPSCLSNWPVQLALMPVNAPYLHQADLLIAADCVPFALPDFHHRFLQGHVLAVGCPKLDDVAFYRRKLTQLFASNNIRSVQVVYMEVPCCTGLVRLVQTALADAGSDTPLTLTRISIRGDVLESITQPA